MKKSAVAIALLLSAFASSSFAGTFETSQFVVTYNDDFWGLSDGTLATGSGNTLTFSNQGLTATATTKGNYQFGGYLANTYQFDTLPFTVVAKAGYQVSSLTFGATGSASVTTTNNTLGYAHANDFSALSWSAYKSPSDFVNGSTTLYSTALLREKGVSSSDTPSAPGAYSVQDTIAFGKGVGQVDLAYDINGYVDAYKSGSVASVSRDTTFFTVAVTAVPEPETYAMLLAGLGMIGTMVRRRKAKQA
jgi:hypothetical protein